MVPCFQSSLSQLFGSFRDAHFEVRSVGQDSDSLQQVMNRCQMFGVWN
jgi:hypothetical protein